VKGWDIGMNRSGVARVIVMAGVVVDDAVGSSVSDPGERAGTTAVPVPTAGVGDSVPES
jgi:hypothetical protein